VGTNTGNLASGDGVSVKATVSSGGTTVTFTGLSLPAMDQVGAMGPGDKITLDPGGGNEDVRYILSRDSATQVTLQSAVSNDHTTSANQDFTIERAYNTLSGWESDRDRDLTAATGDDSIEVAVCYKDGVLQETDVVQIAGWTTAADNYIRIWVPEGQRHTGSAGTGFVLKPNTTSPQTWFLIFWIDENYVRFEGLEIDGSDIENAKFVGGIDTGNPSGSGEIRVDKCLVHDLTNPTQADSDASVYGIAVEDGFSSRITNNIVYSLEGNSSTSSYVAGIVIDDAGSHYVYNNTVYKVGNGNAANNNVVCGICDQGSGGSTVTNNYAGGSYAASGSATVEDFYGTMTASYNISEDDTSDDNGGTGNLTGKAPADQFVSTTAGSENLHLKSGADCLNVGDDLSGTFTDDIDGDTRPTGAGTWDVGADESTGDAPAAALTGTLADGATEAQIVSGGETLIITLTNDTWDATVGADNAITTALINGIDSDGAEGTGWDDVVKANMDYTDVTRTSATVVTIELDPEATYDITAAETITVTVPGTAVVGGGSIAATPTFDITTSAGSLKTFYYSVGTNTGDLYSGNASASSGTLTLASAASNNIGVGDEVQVGSNRYYITGRSTSTVFSIQNSAANGGTPGDTSITFGSQSITINRAFNSLTTAIANSDDTSHLNLTSGDLVTPNYQLNWTCYKDAVMDDGYFAIDGYTTGVDNYIRVYTPVDSSEVGASQRHNGTAGTGFVLQSTCSSGCNHNFQINEEYVRVEGIEIDGSAVNFLMYAAIYTKDQSGSSDIRIDKVIVHDLTKPSSGSSSSENYGIYISDGSARVSNSIVYNITNENADAGTTATGIRHGSSGTGYYYNNTVYNVVNSGNSTDAVYGFYKNGGTVTAANNYVGGVSGGSSADDFSGTFTANYNISEDLTSDDNGGTGNLTGQAPTDQFVSITAGSEDLHLKAGSACLDVGDDLSGTFTDDVDGETRPTGANTWDVGADESDGASDPDDFTQDANIVSWWYLDESSGTRYDGSGTSNNDLTDNNTVTSYSTTNLSVKEGAAAASFAGGSSESLSGTDNASLSVTGNLTLVAWIRPTSVSGDNGIMGKSDGASDRSYYFYINEGNLYAKISPSGGGAAQPLGATTLSTNTWYHAALVYNGTDLRLYLDGVLDSNGASNPLTYSSGIFDSSTAFSIGSRGTTADYFDGQIDEAAVFNRALSADEIQSIYENGLNGVTRMQPDAAQPPVPYFGRSIGENTGTVYGTGTVTLNQGSRRASFSGATLPTNIGEGDVLTIGGSTVYHIASRESASEVIVQEANISGGDHSGAGYTVTRAYSGSDHTPFNSWDADRNGDLVTDDSIQRGICYKDSDGTFIFSDTFDIDDGDDTGTYKDSSHFMWITAHSTARHNGIAGSGVAIDGSGIVTQLNFNRIFDEYTRFEWLEVTNYDGTALVNRQPILVADTSRADNTLIANIILYNYTSENKGINIYSDTTVRNCIIHDGDTGIRTNDATAVATVENCTIFGLTGDGIRSDKGTFVIKNTISVGNTRWDFDIDVTDAEIDISYFGYNMYTAANITGFDPASYDGNNQTPPGTWEALFVDSTSPGINLHLESSGHNALNNADDLSTLFTFDIDDETRPTGAGTWDIGADEYTGAVSNSPPTITVNDPDGTSDTVTVGDNYSIDYDLADSDDTVTVAFYYDSDSSGLNGTAISGACATAAEGTGVTCSWDTTGMTPGSYYVYGVTNDGTNPDVTDYSPGQITINAASGVNLDQTHYRWRNDDGDESGAGTVSVGDVSTATGDQVSSLTFEHVVAGTDRFLLVAVQYTANLGEAVSSVVWMDGEAGEQSLTLVGKTAEPTQATVEIYKLVAPTTGTYNIKVTFDNVLDEPCIAGAITFTGVDQTTPHDTYAGATGESASASVDIPSDSGDLIFNAVSVAWVNPSVDSGQTQHWNLDDAEIEGAAGTLAGSATSTTLTWSLSGSDWWATSGIAINPVSSATWVADEDTKLTDLAKETTKRLRFLVDNSGSATSGAVSYELQVAETATCASGSYTAVDSSTHWNIVDSANVTDGSASENISGGLTDPGTSSWVAGELEDSADSTDAITLAADEFTEIEFAIQATSSATDGGDYCFRLVEAGSSDLDSYSNYAEVSLGASSSLCAFNYLATHQDVTPAGTGWQDVDVSTWVPSGATGVVLQAVNTSAGVRDFLVRKKVASSPDTYVDEELEINAGVWPMVGIDSNRVFQVYTEDNTSVQVYLVGYTGTGVIFFDNRLDKSPGSIGSWQDADIAADTGGDTAIAAIVGAFGLSGLSYDFGLRKPAAIPDTRYAPIDGDNQTWSLVGVNGSEVYQVYQGHNTEQKSFVYGYVTSGVVMFDNAVSHATTTLNTYEDVDITSDLQGSDDATGAIVHLTQDTGDTAALRKNGASHDRFHKVENHQYGIVAIDDEDIFEQKISHANIEL